MRPCFTVALKFAFLLPPRNKRRYALVVQLGKWNAEFPKDGVVLYSVHYPLVLFPDQRRCLGMCCILADCRPVLDHLDQQVEEPEVFRYMSCLCLSYAAKLVFLGCAAIWGLGPKTPAEQRVAPLGLLLLDKAYLSWSWSLLTAVAIFCLLSAGTMWRSPSTVSSGSTRVKLSTSSQIDFPFLSHKLSAFNRLWH